MPGSCSRGWESALSLTPGLSLSCQATELLDAILEGYPKSKKQFFVSPSAWLCPGRAVPAAPVLPRALFDLTQEEVGIETDEDHNVTLPAAV